MTLLVRDEADIVDAQIAFHLHAGVDFVVATDNRSTDGTTKILERYERAGFLHLLREEGDDMRQEEWVTRMARLAATEFGADWVLNADADEFWWPRGGSLKDVFAAIPERYGVIRGCWRHFLPRPAVEDEPFFAERMIVRLCTPGHPGNKETIFHAHQKVAHRGDPNVAIEEGNHNALGEWLDPIRAWHPIEVLHFSFRSPGQLERKGRGGWVRRTAHAPTRHVILLDDAVRLGRIDEFFRSFALTDDTLEEGLAAGTLAIDTRLREALRTLRVEDGSFHLPGSASPLAFPRPAVVEDALYASETSVLVEIDGVVRAESRVEAFEARLASLEQGPFSRLHRLARR